MNHTRILPFLIIPILLCACLPNAAAVSPAAIVTEKPRAGTPMPDVPTIANCVIFPANNIWNTRVDSLPIHPLSDSWIDSIGRDEGFHMDFGSSMWDGGPIGIPYNVVSGSAITRYAFTFYYPE